MTDEKGKTLKEKIAKIAKKSNKNSRKRQPKEHEEEKVIDPRELLKNKLKERLREKKLERTSQVVREDRLDRMEDRLEESKDPRERRKIKEEIDLLNKIDEKQHTFAGEFPEYSDGASYGGAMEHPD